MPSKPTEERNAYIKVLLKREYVNKCELVSTLFKTNANYLEFK